VATSTNGGSTWTVLSKDALPNIGSWANAGLTWAPDVIDRGKSVVQTRSTPSI
jgi:hypothetical protein